MERPWDRRSRCASAFQTWAWRPPASSGRPTGHQHLLIEVATVPKRGRLIPTDEHHRHFGDGQTGMVLHLSPGTHTLQLERGVANHVPFHPPVVSKRITIHVK